MASASNEKTKNSYHGIICTQGAINITGTGSLNITARDCAINAGTQLTIQSGSVTATSTNYDALEGEDVSINGGRVVANANGYAAIACFDSVSISGGTVIANGTGASGQGISLGTDVGSFSITGGAVYSYGGDTALNSSKPISIDSGEITSNTAAGYKYVTILSNSEGNAKLAYASAENKPNGLLNIGSLEFIANQTGIDLSNVYGDYSDAAVEGTHSYSCYFNDGTHFRFSISYGIASSEDFAGKEYEWADIFYLADKRMYEKKQEE